MFLVIYTHILLLFNKQRNKIEMLHNYNFIRFSLKALLTTLTELKAIAPAIQGASNPIAAIGMPAMLYPNAQNKFCLILRIVL